MRLLEDMLTPDEVSAIERVLTCSRHRFDQLVAEAGLDPSRDFRFSDLRYVNLCGADLRGFDFTGSNLRLAVRDDKTIIDDTTVFKDAQVEWLQREDYSVVAKMREVEASQTSAARQKLLAELVNEFGVSSHVSQYFVSAACNAKDIDAFLDFLSYLPTQLSEHQSSQLTTAGQKLLSKKFRASKSRTRREGTASLASSRIVDRLISARGSVAGRVADELAAIVSERTQTKALGGIALDATEADLVEALKRASSLE